MPLGMRKCRRDGKFEQAGGLAERRKMIVGDRIDVIEISPDTTYLRISY